MAVKHAHHVGIPPVTTGFSFSRLCDGQPHAQRDRPAYRPPPNLVDLWRRTYWKLKRLSIFTNRLSMVLPGMSLKTIPEGLSHVLEVAPFEALIRWTVPFELVMACRPGDTSNTVGHPSLAVTRRGTKRALAKICLSGWAWPIANWDDDVKTSPIDRIRL